MTNMDTVTDLLNHAATQDDRWLMLAVLLMLLISLGLGIRWLANQYAATAAKLGAVVEANTEALREVKDVAAMCRYNQAMNRNRE